MKNKILYEALIKKDRDLFKKIPHTDLHCHSITSVSFNEFKIISSTIKSPPKYFKNIKDFNLFLRENIAPLVKNLNIVRLLVRAAFQRLINEGIVYTEMSFDLTIPEYIKSSMEEYLEMIEEEKNRVSNKLKICIEAGLDREIAPQKLFKLFSRSLKNNIFGSIDLYGDEKANPIEDYVNIYKLAYKNGLKLKAHIGEFGSADDVWAAIKKLNLQAIQHGLRALGNKEVIKLLIKKSISLNICPQSNLALHLFKNIKQHPIKQLFDEGVLVTVNSDDFSIFNKSVGEELIDLYDNGLFSEKEIGQIINNGLIQIS